MAQDRTQPQRRRAWFFALVPAVLFALAIAFFLVSRARKEAAAGKPGTPIVFVLSQQHGARLGPEERQAMAAHLQRESGLVVEVRVAPSSLDGIEGFARTADVGLLPLFEYLLAQKEYAVEARLQILRESGATTYAGEILVPANSTWRALADLQGKRFAYVDPYSTSGFVFPAKLLADAGIRVAPEFAGSHEEVIARLTDGRVDAGATYAGAASRERGLRAIARTEAIPNEPLFFRRDLPPEKRDRLLAAMQSFARTKEGQAILRRMGGVTGFRDIENAHYHPVLAALRAAGKSVYEVVPDGIRIESRQRGIEYVP